MLQLISLGSRNSILKSEYNRSCFDRERPKIHNKVGFEHIQYFTQFGHMAEIK
jgi:hypothetical protein